METAVISATSQMKGKKTATSQAKNKRLGLLQEGDFTRLNPGAALREFSVEMLSAEKCREWVLQQLHPEGAYCPSCHRRVIGKRAKVSFWAGRRTWCKFCHKQFSATTGTVLNNCGLDFRAVWLLLALSALGADNKQIAGILRVHPDTVKTWQGKLELVSA